MYETWDLLQRRFQYYLHCKYLEKRCFLLLWSLFMAFGHILWLYFFSNQNYEFVSIPITAIESQVSFLWIFIIFTRVTNSRKLKGRAYGNLKRHLVLPWVGRECLLPSYPHEHIVQFANLKDWSVGAGTPSPFSL